MPADDAGDIRKVVELTYHYAAALDDRAEHDLVDVFTADATLDLGPFGVRTMPDVIGQLREAHVSYRATQHRVFNHLVSVDGDRAQCSCYAESMYSGPGPGALRRLHGRYDDELERVDGAWRISTRRFTLFLEERLAVVE